MSDKTFTLLTVNIDDSELQFGPRSLPGFGKRSGRRTQSNGSRSSAADAASESGSSAEETQDASGGRGIGPLLGLALLGAAAFAARRLLGGDGGDYGNLDNVTDLGVVGGDGGSSREATDEDAVSIEVTDGEGAAGTDEADDGTDADGSGGPSKGKLLLSLALVVGLVLVARKLLGGSEDLSDLEELDDVAPEQ